MNAVDAYQTSGLVVMSVYVILNRIVTQRQLRKNWQAVAEHQHPQTQFGGFTGKPNLTWKKI